MKALILILTLVFASLSSAETLRLYVIYDDKAVSDSGSIAAVDQWMFESINKANKIYSDSNLLIDIDIANRVLLSDISELVFEEASITEAYRFLSQNLEGLVAHSLKS